MDSINNIVKNIVCFYIFMSAVQHLLPSSSYQKYVRFFCGLLLVVLLLSPILEFFYQEDYLLDRISFTQFWQDMDTMQLDVDHMEAVQKETYLSEYEKAIGDDVAQMAREDELTVQKVQVSLREDYTIESMELSVNLTDPGGVYVEKITVGDNSREFPAVQELKQKLEEFYRLEESQIRIAVQEG